MRQKVKQLDLSYKQSIEGTMSKSENEMKEKDTKIDSIFRFSIERA